MALCSPQVAAGGLADLGIQEEVCYGDLPVVPNLATFRRRSTTLTLTKDSYTSEELRSDRMVSDARHGTRRANGDITVELSPGSHHMAWEALLGGYWQSPTALDLTTVAVTLDVVLGNDDIMTMTRAAGDFRVDGFRAGDTVRTSGASPNVNGLNFTVVGFDPAGLVMTVLTPPQGVTGTPHVLNAGILGVRGARVEMGNIPRSFVFERAFSDIGQFIVYRGMKFNTAAVDLPATGIATATFGLMGQNADPVKTASYDGVPELILTDVELGALTFDAVAGTITAAVGNWGLLGVQPKDKVIFDGPGFDAMPQNRNPRTVISLNAGVMTVAEAVQSGVTAGAFTATRVGLPDYTDDENEPVLVAVSGVLVVNGDPVATVTAASFNIDNQIDGSPVVGTNVVPIMLYGLQSLMTGSLTVLFDRGGAGALLYNAFDQEIDVNLFMRLDSSDQIDFLSFFFPRVKVNTGDIGDAEATGLPVTVAWSALKPFPESGHVSQMIIQDSTVVGVP
jgi:hypothetical protein